jgi:predicted lactoylglutathione lyase
VCKNIVNLKQLNSFLLKQVFINLPVNDIEKSLQFYLALGFILNPLFTDENQKCVIWSDAIYVMIQSKQMAGSYLKKPIADSKQFLAASHTLPAENIQKVNELIDQGLQAGGIEPVPVLDEGFMYLRSIEDLDGHVWGIIHLDIEKFKALKGKS